jgi:orotate phosphoribosyltransferase
MTIRCFCHVYIIIFLLLHPKLILGTLVRQLSIIIMNIAAKVARHLLEIEAVRLNIQEPFTWASGILSPIYCDNRIALSYPAVRSFLKQCLSEQAHNFQEFNTVAGVATAGIPHGVLLADALDLPFVYVRASAKDHGRRNLIEGELAPGSKVLVVEDLVSTGGSVLKVIDALREADAKVAGVLAIFQYGFDAAIQAFEAQGVDFQTLTNYEVLIQEAVNSGYITHADLEALRQWRQNPKGWGALYA